MPLYEFKCNECSHKFDDLVPMSKCEECPDTECPECHSKNWTKLVSCANFAFSNPVGTDRWNNSSTGHDYRFKHNIPNVKKEREMAEKLSHMGANPYGDTTEADIQLDTGIHDPETRQGLA